MNLKIFIMAIVFVFSLKGFSQNYTQELADTIQYLIKTVSKLEVKGVSQEATRLIFDDCLLEFNFNYEDGNYAIYSFRLNEVDERKLNLAFDERTEHWRLVIASGENQETIKASGSRIATGLRSSMALYSSDKNQLVTIGETLWYSIQTCKSEAKN